MKYIKLFESSTEYKVGDYILKKNYDNFYPDKVLYSKIIDIIPIYKHIGDQRVPLSKAYKIKFYNQRTLDIYENLIDRKLTEEEIEEYEKDAEEFEMKKNANKYNI